MGPCQSCVSYCIVRYLRWYIKAQRVYPAHAIVPHSFVCLCVCALYVKTRPKSKIAAMHKLCLFNMVRGMLRLVLDELCRHADRPGLREPDGGPDGGRVPEHHVDLLEVAAHRLGVEQVNGDGDAEADDGENDIVLPANGFNRNWGYHDDDKVPTRVLETVCFLFTRIDCRFLHSPEPVVRGGDGGHGHPQADGRNLGTVQEVCAEEADGHECVEQVDENTGGDLGGLVVGAHGRGDGKGNHASAHAGSRDNEDGAASEAVDGEEGDEGRQELPGQRASSKGAGVLRGHSQVGLEDDGCVHRDEVGTPGITQVSKMSHYML